MSLTLRSSKGEHNATMSIGSAAARVFGLPELLEFIFLNAPPVDLFAMRRVNHDFLTTLNSYASLRARMHRELGGWDFSSLQQIMMDPRLEKAIFPFRIIKLSRQAHNSGKFQRYILLLGLNEMWLRANQNTTVRTLFTKSLLQNVEGSWGLIGITQPRSTFKVEMSVAGRIWGIHRWTHPYDDSLRLYQVIHKCMHIVSRGWKKGWHKEAIEYLDSHAWHPMSRTMTIKGFEESKEEVTELKKMRHEDLCR